MLRTIIGAVTAVAVTGMATAVIASEARTAQTATTARAATTAQDVQGGGWGADPPIPVGKHSFGADVVGVYDGRMPTIDIGSVRLWDDRTRWSYIEKERGRYDWKVLDTLVDGARAKGLPVLYTMGQTPRWANPDGDPCPYNNESENEEEREPCTSAPPQDLNVWDEYVRQVVTRYKGRIEAYELWNEATLTKYYSGTVPQMVAMAQRAYRIIKEIDPSALVISPSATMMHRNTTRDWVAQFAAQGGYAYADRVAVHLYKDGDDKAIGWPERSVEIVNDLRAILASHGVTKPIWDTETTEEPEPDPPFPGTAQQAADWVTRYYLMGLYNRLSRSYYYGWGSKDLGLKVQTAGEPPTLAGRAAEQLVGWMKGASIRYCGSGTANGLPGGMWQCAFTYGQGEYALIRWMGMGAAPVRYGTGAGTYEAERIGGQPWAVRPGDTIEINGTPVIIRYKGA